jgi:hypothetical protein
MLERFTRERQRASKGDAFHLEDEVDLTHYGQSLSKLDDFVDARLELETDEETKGSFLASTCFGCPDLSQVRSTARPSRSHTLEGSKVKVRTRMR